MEYLIQKLNEWLSSHDNLYPKQDSLDELEKTLSLWVCSLRQDKKNGKLDDEKSSLLETPPGWKWVDNNGQFEGDLEKLKDWLASHG